MFIQEIQKKIFFISAIIGIVALGYFFIAKSNPVEILPPLSSQALASAQAGIRWILDFNGKIEDPGVLWVIQEINNEYCHAPELSSFVESRFEEFEEHPIDRKYKRFFDGVGYLPKKGSNVWDNSERAYDDIILSALYCEEIPVSDAIIKKTFNTSQAVGYDLTHQFLTMMLLKQRGCLPNEYEKKFVSSAELLFSQTSKMSFGDVFVESVAFLEKGYREKKIPDTWIKEIVEKQNLSGAWQDEILSPDEESPHVTALAAWALTQYAGACPISFVP